MKRTLKIKVLSVVLSMCLLTAQLTGVCALAGQNAFFDDFESYNTGYNLRNAGYTVWHGASVGDDGSNKYLVMNRTNPIAAGEEWGKDSRNDARLARQFDSEPGERVIVGLDFMMTQNPNDYSAEIFGVMSDDSNKYSANIRLERGVLYDGRTTSDNRLRTELKQDKWYNAFLVLDLVNDTYKLYSGEYESETKNFQQATSAAVDRFIGFRIRSLETPIYFDNIGVSVIEHETLDIAICKARGLLLEREEGYGDGQYPKTAYTMLKDEYEKAVGIRCDASLTEESARNAGEALENAITRFKESKIDTSLTGGTGKYITFNIPSRVAVGDETDYSCTLSATVYDRAKQPIEEEITWELSEGSGATIENGRLKIEKGTRGDIVIKALAGDLYDYHTITAGEGKTVKYAAVDSRNGVMRVTGEFSEKPACDIRISVESDFLNLTGEATVTEEKTFSKQWQTDASLPYDSIRLVIEGDDIAQYTKDFPFYGVGWKENVLSVFNSAKSKKDVENAVKKYYVGVDIDLKTYEESTDSYNEHILKGVPYSSIEELTESIADFECVFAFKSMTAENVRQIIAENINALVRNGFRKNDFDALSSDDETIFYSSLVLLSFDKEDESASTIAEALNGVLENVINPSGGEDGEGVIASVFADDYESYPIGNSLGGGNYGLRQGVTVIGDENNQYLEVKRTEPMQSGETFGSDNNQYNARVSKEFDEEPGEKVIVALDFMMPANPNNYSTEIFGVMSDDGNYYAANIRLERGVLYDGRLTSTNPVMTGFESGKWYNAFLYLDLVNNKYKLFCGEYESGLKDFQGKVVVKTNRLFMVRVRNYNDPLYIDNLDISTIKYQDLGIALYSAKSIMNNSEIGYENGQHPQSAYNMLESTYNKMLKASKSKDITAAQATIYANALNEAIEMFKGNKIGTTGTAGKASYIKFSIPSAIGVDDAAGSVLNLNAQVFDFKNDETASSVLWNTEKNYIGVSVNGSNLNIDAGVRGDILIRAAADDIYDIHKLKLTDFKKVTNADIDSRNGKLSLSGVLNKAPLEKINISVTGGGLNISREIEANANAEFKTENNIDPTLPFGYITVNMQGNDTALCTKTVPLYGVGWENAVLAEFNGAQTVQETADNINMFYIGTGIDMSKYAKYPQAYNNRIFAKRGFAAFSELKNYVSDLQCVIDFYESTRNDIQIVTSREMPSLVRNGFNEEGYSSLTDEQKIGFFTAAAAIEIDINKTTASEIAGILNGKITEIKGTDITKEPSGGSGGGGGGGYKIDLKPTPSTDANGGSSDTKTDAKPFEDTNLAPWASDALLYLRGKGIMVGDGTNVFPLQAVTRGEFSKIIAVAFSLKDAGNTHSFSDAQNKWWEEYAKIMSSHKIMNGIEETLFGGDDVITRQMLATAVYRALSVANIELYDQNEEISFKDSDVIADYAKDAVMYLAKKGVVQGTGEGLFAPEAAVTRAEAAQLVYNILKQTDNAKGAA